MIKFGEKPLVMGILNYTDDSFSDGGDYFTPSAALERAGEMVLQGADIIDIGACSTRPGSSPVSEEEETAKLLEVFSALEGRIDVPLSADTFRPACARAALEHGAVIINDVSGKLTEEMASLAVEYGAHLIVTHNPCGASEKKDYPFGAVEDVRQTFLEFIALAKRYKLPASSLILDPGFGFGKDTKDNLELLDNLRWVKFSGYPLLAGLSRKRFIGEISGEENPKDRDRATLGANVTAILNGADIIRVHNVPFGVEAVIKAKENSEV